MSRNVNSFFSENPVTMDMSRSKFERNQNVKLTMNAGKLVPFYLDEVLPGDTMSIDTSEVVRMSTMISPIMDNIYMDIYYFFIPNRLVWEHWKNFMGESDKAWLPSVSYSVPQINSPTGSGFATDSLADYLGLPTKVPGFAVSHLPIRAYCAVVNDWFRDENLIDPIYYPVNDTTVNGFNRQDIDFVQYGYCGSVCFDVAKYHDYFTSCLPAPWLNGAL